MKTPVIFLLGIVFFLAALPHLLAVGEVNFCCEKTLDVDAATPGYQGGYCQNAPKELCSTAVNRETGVSYRAVPTSCEATSFCKLGTCINTREGTCIENTPEVVCTQNGGLWKEGTPNEIPQCSLGCCTVGDQAAFVTQTRCKRLSALYGLTTNFRSDLVDEISCIASVSSEEKGACVFDTEIEKTCKMLTQKECQEAQRNSGDATVTFHEGYLCSAEELATNCGPTQQTTCVEDKDEVYFVDSCGNLANIYDASKIRDTDYWARMYDSSESCTPSSSNANSATCGNCDYYLGSTCKSYERGIDTVQPTYGENLCRDLGCEYEGERYEHGETWCATNAERANTPGSEYYRLVCYNSEVTVENCNAFRSEVCVESEVNGFSTAACRANRWQDCVAQETQRDCENTDKRDCRWIASGERNSENGNIYVCAPLTPPGFDFWKDNAETENICSLASTTCTATFEKGLLGGDWKCVDNCHCCVDGEDEDGNTYEGCTGEDYLQTKEALCSALGDCGQKTNYLNRAGYYDDEDSLTCNGDACYWIV